MDNDLRNFLMRLSQDKAFQDHVSDDLQDELAMLVGGMRWKLHAKSGAQLIAEERYRQTLAEGWTPLHDARHTEWQLSAAGICYARIARSYGFADNGIVPLDWPFEASWWKPYGGPTRCLQKAGALLAAEIDRLSFVEASRRQGQWP